MIKRIETKLDIFEIYTLLKENRGSFILDSSMYHETLGRYTIVGSEPIKYIKKNAGDKALDSFSNELKAYSGSNDTDLPFVGGAVGYFSYDLCHEVESLPRKSRKEVDIPDIYIGIYDLVIVHDKKENATYIASPNLDQGIEEEKIERLIKYIKASEENFSYPSREEEDEIVEVRSNFLKDEYLETIDKVRSYIRSGDIYQANLTQRFKGNTKRTAYDIYRSLREVSPATFGAFLNFDEVQIMSNSPERFLKIKDRLMETRPIKGTRPRGIGQEDLRLMEELKNSEKDKSELLMIVDLERNDLGRVSKTGSVKVPELFKLETYANVHHLVSTIRGQMKDEATIADVMKATFPGGSITGAPKIRAMEVIDELEPTQRNVYTGSIGYIGFDGQVDLNIAIRTIVKVGDEITFQVGGGITWDSNPQEEYEETLHKGKSILKAIRGIIKND